MIGHYHGALVRFRHVGNQRIEFNVSVLPQPDRNQRLNTDAKCFGQYVRVDALDGSGGPQPSHPLEAGRRRDPVGLGQVLVRDAAVTLQRDEQVEVCSVKLHK